jgi:small-conductance mechanosensitive channel
VDALTVDLEVISQYESVEVTGRMGPRDLEAVLQQWRAVARQSSAISREISVALDRYERWGLETEAMVARWARTAAQMDSSALYLPTIPQIQLSQIETRDLVARLDSLEVELLSLASTTSSIENRVRAATARTRDDLALVRRRLLIPNQRPLWSVPLGDYSPAIAAREAGIFLRGRLGFVAEYMGGRRSAVLIHALLILLLAGVVRWLGTFVGKAGHAVGTGAEGESEGGEDSAPEDGGGGDPAGTVEVSSGVGALVSAGGLGGVGIRSLSILAGRPVSAGYLLSLLLVPLIYGQLPILVSDVLFLLSMLPAARISLSVEDDELRAGALSLLALSIGTYLVAIGLSAAQVKRVLLLVIAAGTLVLLRQIQSSVRSAASPSWLLRAFEVVARAMAWGMVVAMVASAVGLTNLSGMLVIGIVSLLYVTMLLRIFFLTSEGILRVLPYTPLSAHLISLRKHPEILVSKSRTVLQLVLAGVWLSIAFRYFGMTGVVSDAVWGVLGLGVDVGNFHMDLGDVLAFVATLWIALLISRFLRFVFMEDVVPRADWPKGTPEAMATLGQYAILTIGFAVALVAANIPMDRIALLVSALGIGVGFGLQNIVNNFVSGLILLFERPLAVGDTLEMGPLLAEVKRIGIRASVVRTFDGAEVIVPNAELIQSQVVNWTLSDRRRRLEVKVGVRYGTDPTRVLPLLREAALAHPEVLREPAPVALFREFGDSSLNFAVRFWIAEPQRFWTVWSEVTISVSKALEAAGIEIPFPQRDLHLKTVTEGAGTVLRGSVDPTGPSAHEPDRAEAEASTEETHASSGDSDA